jgi:CRISPR-associated exonuclease Cas4
MYAEDDLVPLSALQHLVYCERRCALVHVEGIWQDNVYTIEGEHLHSVVDETGRRHESRGEVRVARGLTVRSLRLGLSGRADVVEFHRLDETALGPPGGGLLAIGCPLGVAPGLWRPYPVEYKRGEAEDLQPYKVQLCAQALCLEEMLAVTVPEGALFEGAAQHRVVICFDAQLRAATEAASARVHELLSAEKTPAARKGPWCRKCSLLAACRPDATAGKKSARGYLRRLALSGIADETGRES